MMENVSYTFDDSKKKKRKVNNFLFFAICQNLFELINRLALIDCEKGFFCAS